MLKVVGQGRLYGADLRLQTELATRTGVGQLGDQGVALLGESDDPGIEGLDLVDLGLPVTGVGELQQRSNLIVAAASRSSTALLDAVRTPTVPLSKSTIQMSALAGLLGLIGGLGLAAALETLHPTLRNPKAISYAVGAPIIGRLNFNDLQSPPRAAAMSAIADRMALLGLRHDSSRALLLSVRSADQSLAVEIAEGLRADGEVRTSHRLQCEAMNGHWIEPGDHPAIVIFSPSKILSLIHI